MRGVKKERGEQPSCGCGCGQKTNWLDGRWARFIGRHQLRLRRKDKGTPPLCACGCGVMVSGRKNAEWVRFVHGHRSRSEIRTAQQFWDRVDKSTACGCWVWTGGLSGRRGSGYPAANIDGYRVYGHQWVWEQFNGPIPKGQWVLHKCDNTTCVRPDHLFLGNAKANTEDMISKQRGWWQSHAPHRNNSSMLLK